MPKLTGDGEVPGQGVSRLWSGGAISFMLWPKRAQWHSREGQNMQMRLHQRLREGKWDARWGALTLQNMAHQGQPTSASSSKGPSWQPWLQDIQERLVCTCVCGFFLGGRVHHCAHWILSRVSEPPKKRLRTSILKDPSIPPSPAPKALLFGGI